MYKSKRYFNYIMRCIHDNSFMAPAMSVAAAIMLLVIALFVWQLDSLVYNSTVSSMEEVAQHDMQSVKQHATESLKYLRIVARELKEDNCTNMVEAESWMGARTYNGMFDSLTLIDSEGNVFRDTHLRVKMLDENQMGFFLDQSRKNTVITRYDWGSEANVESKVGMLLYAIQVEPFKIGDHTIVGISGTHRMSTIANQLRIDSFGGNGYSAIITETGDLLINVDSDASVLKRENFYDSLQKGRMYGQYSIENIRKKIVHNEKVVFRYEDAAGVDKVVMVLPMDNNNNNWAYVMSVPYSYFSDQSIHFIWMTGILLLTVLIIVGAALFVTYRSILSVVRSDAENRAQNEFLTNMSHEIRTPLNGIIGFNRMMELHLHEPKKIKELLSKSQDTSNYLMGLVNDILDVSKMKSGKFVVNESTFDLQQMLYSTSDMMAARIKEKNLKIVEEYNIKDNFLISDEFHIKQTLINILSNAVKFTPEGGTITLSVWQEKTNYADIVNTIFCCADTGCGISEEFQKNIFQYFSQERNKTNDSIKGVGLGLSISKMIVDNLNGQIWVNSDLGVGSKFFILIPMTISAEDLIANKKEIINVEVKEITEESEGKKAATQEKDDEFNNSSEADEVIENSKTTEDSDISNDEIAKVKKRHVLVVEDNEINAMILQELLASVGITSDWAEDGERGFEMFNESHPGKYDAIFMDIQMPIMNGYESARKIRALDREDAKDIYICACTANVYVEHEQKCYECGMNNFLAKPIDMDNFNHILEEF